MKITSGSGYFFVEVRKGKSCEVEIGSLRKKQGKPISWFADVKALDTNPPKEASLKARTWAAVYRAALRAAAKMYVVKSKNKVRKEA